VETTRPRRSIKGQLIVAASSTVLVGTMALLGAAPAKATDFRCTQSQLQINCGVIYNTSGASIRIATNFSPTYGSDVGTVSGFTATLGGTQNSNSFKDGSGRFYDWDAVYVPPRHCLTMNVGPGLASTVQYRNTRTTGVWYKVNNVGANVRGLRSC
jgi:hypothetical protein